MTHLDQAITSALKKLTDVQASSFDLTKYINEFRRSAQNKAREVLRLLEDKDFPFSGSRPVFVSIGGGDGEELDYLLRNTDGSKGILIELSHDLAELARERNPSLPRGKVIEVFEGDAKDKVAEAVSVAHRVVAGNEADYVAITCHAVIHELFDRGKDEFDPLSFFASLFSDVKVSTWFTYREPGVPEKWPSSVLLGADCSPKSLLELAEAIRIRHQTLRDLLPQPLVIGDRLRLHSTLAFEVLAKLFYLDDLQHEIEERSTAVDHRTLTNSLWLAIGETAQRANRASIISFSAPTKSFVSLWQEFGVSVLALGQDNTTAPLSIAESQTRLVAWRLAPQLEERPIDGGETAALSVANQALEKGDSELLTALLLSKGRAWIESIERERAVTLLKCVTASVPMDRLAYLWSHYLLSIASLFAGESVSPEMFSEKLEVLAGPVGLALLFRAERMEFLRKQDGRDAAITIANAILPVLNQSNQPGGSLDRYILGTCRFLLGSLLRYGGLYVQAWELIDGAQKTFIPGIDSHETELAHCYYAKSVCTAMTGISNFDTPFDLGSESTRQFAAALIQLSYSHAAWFLDDVSRSKEYALTAAASFESIGTPRYASRANELARFLAVWDALKEGKEPRVEDLGASLTRAVQALTGHTEDLSGVASWLGSQRPSKALGLLQFAKEFSPAWSSELEIHLPRTLELRTDGTFEWHAPRKVNSLKEADAELRISLAIPLDRRLPLIAD